MTNIDLTAIEKRSRERYMGLAFKDIASLIAEVKRLAEDNARLRDALRPFAAFWDSNPSQCKPHWPTTLPSYLDSPRQLPLMVDCKTASDVLKESEAPK